MKRYQPLELVGKGGFSEVYRSYDLYANQTVAIKLSSVEHLLQGCGNKHEYLKHIKREYEIHKQLDHPNIVKLTEVIEI
jgi:tousled-like kinase